MQKLISVKSASNIILTINILALFMHAMILLEILPYHFVWGGRVNSKADLLTLETISIVIQTIFIIIIAIKAGYLFKGRFGRTVNVCIWVMFGIMVLNTIGNLLSISSLETMLMTPLTTLLAILLFRLGTDRTNRPV
ncbi:hypothetical protein [Litchfieldia salsa]|uniref:Uncharacterized protein n=1 Tax=Litchfieldia salsa TaxID=930152 RepID=A0A1H0SUL9_9BACI|nr:hypothetical protein [Litchfieldia salsa]SDP45433.1 hypothetical protein SAMN05216565_103127 [Litchfieldia salsa]